LCSPTEIWVSHAYEVELTIRGIVGSIVMFTPHKAWSGADSASNPNSVTPNLSRRGDGIKGSGSEAAALDQEGLAEKIYRLENEVIS